jgi:hypothetical protein
MPKVWMKVTEKDGSQYEVNATGWYFAILNLHSHPQSQIKRWIKEYDVTGGKGEKNEQV